MSVCACACACVCGCVCVCLSVYDYSRTTGNETLRAIPTALVKQALEATLYGVRDRETGTFADHVAIAWPGPSISCAHAYTRHDLCTFVDVELEHPQNLPVPSAKPRSPSSLYIHRGGGQTSV